MGYYYSFVPGGIKVSETIKNLGSKTKMTKKESEQRYEEYLEDPLTFSLDEMLQTLGPRKENIRR